jgi:hypothetical protein
MVPDLDFRRFKIKPGLFDAVELPAEPGQIPREFVNRKLRNSISAMPVLSGIMQ